MSLKASKLYVALSIAGLTLAATGCGEDVPPEEELPDLSGMASDMRKPGDMAKPAADLTEGGDDLPLEVQDMESPGEDLPLQDDGGTDDAMMGGDDQMMGGDDQMMGGDDQMMGGMCNTSADCPKGQACDPMTKMCGVACAGGLTCNGGCCDGQNCVAGDTGAACGDNGGACVACGGGTPTCAGGACTDTCAVGGMGGAACGQGFCCNAMNKCSMVGGNACAKDGQACADCSKSPDGPACVMGACGCASEKDCPAGQACTGGKCTTTCDMNTPCNGGCCDVANKKCAPGNTQTACALGMAACGSCANNMAGTACVAGQMGMPATCGCGTAKDCAVGQACDKGTGKCGTKCDANNPCNGGCCLNGMCVKGDAANACGDNGGLCSTCSPALGKQCIKTAGGGKCGCNDRAADCDNSATACTNNVCIKTCNDTNLKCVFGCCNAANNGTCVNGTAATACGKSGLCLDCSKSADGKACLPAQTCGCNSTADCPAGHACNKATQKCVTACNTNQPCNGGCCSAAANGTCNAGTAGATCGNTGNVCLNCASAKEGKACIGGAKCGCNNQNDCAPGQACNTVTKVCDVKCGAQGLTVCNGGCCAGGLCVAGTANGACGGNGGACVACKNDKPTCVAGACNTRCGGPNDGTCGGGFCCKGNACVAGNQKSACGYDGACEDCSNNSKGTACLNMGNNVFACGCNNRKEDCLAANSAGGIPGFACESATKTCTSLCGAMGVSTCNGGCCSGPAGRCLAGNADGACGKTGGFCSNCASGCNPGPRCNAATGSCGCSSTAAILGDCFVGNCFFGNQQRIGCNTQTKSCCIPGTPGANKDNGAPAQCCTGMSMNGNCTCLGTGQNTGNPPSAGKCCSLQVDGAGNCRCVPKGGSCNLFGADGVVFSDPRACCSGVCNGGTCQ